MDGADTRSSKATDESVREHIRKMLRQIPRNEAPYLTLEAKRVRESGRIAVEVE